MSNPYVPKGVSELPWIWTHGNHAEGEYALWDDSAMKIVARGLGRKDAAYIVTATKGYPEACRLLGEMVVDCCKCCGDGVLMRCTGAASGATEATFITVPCDQCSAARAFLAQAREEASQ